AASAYEILGRVRTWLAEYRKAEENLLESHRLKSKLYGDDSAEVAINNLYRSELLIAKDEYDEAYTLASNALNIIEKLKQPANLTLAQALSTKGLAAIMRNRAEEAEPLLSKAHGIRSTALGNEDRLVGESLDLLSQCSAALENYTLAGTLG